MASAEGDRPQESGDSDALDVLLERALLGDAVAARMFVTLLQTRYHQSLVDAMRQFPAAHTQTVEDVIQDTIISLMEKLESGELRDLSADDRSDFLKYFKRLLMGALRNTVRERMSPVLAREKEPLREEILDDHAPIPGDARDTEHLVLIKDAMGQLDPESARLLQMYLDQIPFSEIARITGKKEHTLKNDVRRIKQELRMEILPRSATAQLHLETQERRARTWPSRTDIEAAIRSVLPPEIEEAVVFVHLQHQTIDELARTLGDRGYEKAQARLRLAYRTLSGRLKAPFPEAFLKAAP
jgi:RNA polymerase sigma factor (sigma-70 family)